MRKALAELYFHQLGKITFAVDVRVYQQERLSPEQRQRIGDAAGGFQALALARVAQAQPIAAAVAQPLDDALAEVRHVDHRLAKAGARQALEMPADQRLAAGLDQRFRDLVGDRAQPFAAARRQQHRLHASSSSSRASGASSRYLFETEEAYVMKRGVSARYFGL